MNIISKVEFEAFLDARNITGSRRDEPRVERDGEYKYECYDDEAGEEVAFITYQAGEAPTYHIRTADQ